jgi:hypothetical protein
MQMGDLSMSDGITDAHRESRFKSKSMTHNYVSMTRMPERCHNCIFITRNPHDNQLECTNPLQHGQCDEPNNCAFHITLEELAVYLRQRLKAKLTGKSPVLDKSLRCKYILDDDYGMCSKTDEFRCPFVGSWNIAGALCKEYEFTPSRFEVHVLGKDNYIIGIYSSRKLAEQFIKDNVKIVEMVP